MAASGGIGQILVQLAKRAGARVFATTSSEEKAAVARARGADFALLYDDGRFADAVRAATGGAGVDVVYDAIGKATLRDSFRAARKRGLIVNLGAVAGAGIAMKMSSINPSVLLPINTPPCAKDPYT